MVSQASIAVKALVGIDYDDDEVNQLIADADEDGDGCLCFSDLQSRSRHSKGVAAVLVKASSSMKGTPT